MTLPPKTDDRYPRARCTYIGCTVPLWETCHGHEFEDLSEFRDREERALDALDYREHILGSIEALEDLSADELPPAIDEISRVLLRVRRDEAA